MPFDHGSGQIKSLFPNIQVDLLVEAAAPTTSQAMSGLSRDCLGRDVKSALG